MRVLTIAMLLSSAFFLTPLSTRAKGHIDQSAIGPEWGIFNIRDAGLEQTFRPESTILTGVTVGLDRMGQGPTNVTLTIRSDDSAGPIVGSTTKLISDYASGMPFDFLSGTHLEYFGFAAAPPLTPGHVYVIRLDADAGGLGWVNVGEDVYLPGQASSRWGPLWAGWDFIFQTCGDGQGKVCKEKTQLLDRTHKAKEGPGDCIDLDAGTECSPF